MPWHRQQRHIKKGAKARACRRRARGSKAEPCSWTRHCFLAPAFGGDSNASAPMKPPPLRPCIIRSTDPEDMVVRRAGVARGFSDCSDPLLPAAVGGAAAAADGVLAVVDVAGFAGAFVGAAEAAPAGAGAAAAAAAAAGAGAAGTGAGAGTPAAAFSHGLAPLEGAGFEAADAAGGVAAGADFSHGLAPLEGAGFEAADATGGVAAGADFSHGLAPLECAGFEVADATGGFAAAGFSHGLAPLGEAAAAVLGVGGLAQDGLAAEAPGVGGFSHGL